MMNPSATPLLIAPEACWLPMLIIYFDHEHVVYDAYPTFSNLNDALHCAYRARAEIYCPEGWKIVPGVRSITPFPRPVVA